MIDYQSLIQSESLILFIDFFKAFDTVEHEFIFTTLRMFGFGEGFCKVIKMFYNNIYSYISLNPGMTSRIEILRGIRQGCPISPKLFILCTQMLAYLVVNHPQLKGITISEYEYRISQFADDTVIFLKDKSIVKKALKIISVFSGASGLCLNFKKCELFPLFSCNEENIESIPVKFEVKYLGLKMFKEIHTSIHTRELVNIEERIDSMKKSLNHWLMRDLSIMGRILLTKAEGISKLIYPCCSLYVSPQLIKKVNSILFNFIWKNKTHYIKKSQMIKEYNNGGLKASEFESMVGVLKLNWIKMYLAQPNSMWFHIPKSVFKKVGGLDFLLKCDFEVSKLPIKLSKFHKQILYYWKMIFTQNVSPHCSTLWNNRTITVNRKTVFKKEWYGKNVLHVVDLLDETGQIIQHNAFMEKFEIKCSFRDFNTLCKAIPFALKQLIQNTLTYSKVSVKLPELKIGEVYIGDKKCNNKVIGNVLKYKLFSDFNTPSKLKQFENEIFKKQIL